MLPATSSETETLIMVPHKICQRFSLDEIRSATQNFDEAHVVGHGGFGKVYKGFIKKDDSETVVAIKISNSMSNQGAPEFRTEVEMLSRLRHCNLVSLIGYCYEGEVMALVYEYMPEGTLEDHLHKAAAPLSWLQLLKICTGAAHGLHYLHTGTGTQHGIIHRDIKSSNILLDKNFAAKISDFGLAKIGPTNQTHTHVSTMVKGTFGYMDPCYFHTGKLTRKSDVYSFGVILLEVICGRPAVDTSLDEENQWGLAPWAQDCIKDGKRDHIIDSRLRGQISKNCLKTFVQLASRCLHNQPNQRPRMVEIVATLDAILSLQERSDCLIIEEKFIDKCRAFFQTKVGSNGNDLISYPPLGSQDKQSEETDGKVKNAMETTGKGKVTSPLSPQSPTNQTKGNLKHFSFTLLKTATGNFRPGRVLGSNLDQVFKGWIDEPSLSAAKPGTGTIIAVKKINQQGDQGHGEWLDKINYLGLLDHPNLVKLIGYCIEDNDRYLVCEFMRQGSLENALFRRGANVEPLAWNLRIKVALGAAKGLAYLHSRKAKVIYCNIKTNNILVDSDHNAKLSNFWLTEDVEAIGNPLTTLRIVANTYAAPEYVATGCFTAASDIYSFGVVLHELLTGKQNTEDNCGELSEQLTTKAVFLKIIGLHSSKGQNSQTVAARATTLLMKCLSGRPSERATADMVVKALESFKICKESSTIPPKLTHS